MQEMNVRDAIRTRSSIGKVKPDDLSRETITGLIESAIQAPNHHLTEPWVFNVLQGHAREELGRVMAEDLLEAKPQASEEEQARERAKPLRAPVIIAVGSRAGSEPEETQENYAATAAAVQNLLLEAHAVGLGAQWRTGAAAYSPRVKEWLGLTDADQIVSLVYIGYPDMEPKHRRRSPAADKIIWRD